MRTIYFLSFLFFACPVFAQESENSSLMAWYAIDPTSTLNIYDLNKLEFSTIDVENGIDIGYMESGRLWCKLRIHNKTKGSKVWLCFDNTTIDSLIVYADHGSKLLGDRTNNNSPFLHTLAFQLNLKPNEEKIIYFSVKKIISFVSFSFYLSNEEILTAKSKTKTVLISFLLGMMFLLFVFNIILYFITKAKMYVYYSMVVVGSGFYVAITTNFLKYIFFSDFTYFSEMRYFVAVIWFIFFSSFLAHFLELKKNQLKKYHIIVCLNLLNVLLILIAISLLCLELYAGLKALTIINYVNLLIINLIILWTAVTHLKIDYKNAVYVLIAFTPQLIWAVLAILVAFQFIEVKMGDNSLILSCCYEVLLFGFVLAKNYLATFQKNNQLIKEIILERESSLQAITQTQIRERRTIANVLHDNVGSKIAYITQLMQLENVTLASDSIKDLAEEVREISHKILPKSLDEGALFSSLQDQINILNKGLQPSLVTLCRYDFPDRISEKWVHDLYLMSLEIINNAVKHGLAKLIEIEFYKYKNYYLFQFTDDGIGFDALSVKKGFGLESIEKRVVHYKGTIGINSNGNFGTVIQIEIPF